MRHLVSVGVFLLIPCLSLAQEKTVPIPPNVKVDGMPPIPQSIAESLTRYAQYHTAQFQAWHHRKRLIII
jgi:hypothetical protein